MSTPKVSVVMPTYNRAVLLGQSIRSVLAQSCEDFELIVVDDGSTDDTEEVVTSFDDDRIVYMRQANQERSAARNNGIRAARADVIAFLDDDDLWFSNTLATHVAVLDRYPAVGLVYSRWVRIDIDNEFPFPLDFVNWCDGEIVRNMRSELLVSDPIATPTVAVRKCLLEQTGGFDPSIRLAEDWDLWIRVAALCDFCEVCRPLAACRVHSGNSVGALHSILSGEMAVVAKHPGSDESAEATRARAGMLAYGRRSFEALRNGMAEQARSWLAEAGRRAIILDELDVLRDTIVSCALSGSPCNKADWECAAGLVKAAAHGVADPNDAALARAWSRAFWAACLHAAYVLRDNRLCLWSAGRLFRSSCTSALDRGRLRMVLRALAGSVVGCGGRRSTSGWRRTMDDCSACLPGGNR